MLFVSGPNDLITYKGISAHKVGSSAEKGVKSAYVGKSAVQALNLLTIITLLFLHEIALYFIPN